MPEEEPTRYHACHQILVQNGVKFFTHAEVSSSSSKTGGQGIRLADGSVVNARKVVISAGLSPMQLVEFMGRDVIGEKTAAESTSCHSTT